MFVFYRSDILNFLTKSYVTEDHPSGKAHIQDKREHNTVQLIRKFIYMGLGH